MGKLADNLKRQLKTEHQKDAEDCIQLYNYLKESNNGHVWESQWNTLTTVNFEGIYPNNKRRYKPNNLGYAVLKGLNSN